MTDLGTVLTLLRVVRGWNQEELARACGLRSNTVSDYERGKMIPGTVATMKLLAAQGYSWKAIDLTQEFVLRMRIEGSKPAQSVEPTALAREIEDISSAAGSAVYRIVRLALRLLAGGRKLTEADSGGVAEVAP